MINARLNLAGAGSQNATIAFGGQCNSATALVCTEEYDGSAWTAGCTLITGRYGLAGAGSQNAALAVGGECGLACTEEYVGAFTSPLSLTGFNYSTTNGIILLSQVSASLDYASDACACAAGVPLGGLYRNGSVVQIRIC